jgi:predicted RNase H-like nuclease
VTVPVLGVDGCRAWWVGALLRGTTYDVLVAADIASLVESARRAAPGIAVVGIDIPIGLPDETSRAADALARKRLPVGRKSSVFPTPSRAAVEQTTHPEASAANRAAVGVGLSVQAYHLVPKILDVDAYVRRAGSTTVLEVHPEVSFAEIDPSCVVASKTTPEGAAARRHALMRAGLDAPAYARGQGYAADDLLDACVVAWTASRYAAGTAYSLPDPPEIFSDGLPAAIWV